MVKDWLFPIELSTNFVKRWLLALAMLASLLQVGNAESETPTNTIKGIIEKVESIHSLRDTMPPEERRRQIFDIVDPHVDYVGLAKGTLSGHWAKLSSSQQAEFTALFRELLRDTLMAAVEKQAAFSVFSLSERMDNDVAVVIFTGQDGLNEVCIFTSLKLFNGSWRIVDINREGVSVMNNFRAQFAPILREGGVEELMNRMRHKLKGAR